MADEERSSRGKGDVFKIDFEKTYDHVELGILDHALERKKSNTKWRSMRGCLFSTSFAIIANGNAKGWVKATRGLRQRDPLSPFLFTIAVDVLRRMMLKVEDSDLFESLIEGKNRTRVYLLQFIDDTIFFSKASMDGSAKPKANPISFWANLKV